MTEPMTWIMENQEHSSLTDECIDAEELDGDVDAGDDDALS